MIWTTLLRLREELQKSPTQNCIRIGNTGCIERHKSSTSSAIRLHFKKIGERKQPLTVFAHKLFDIEFAGDHALLDAEYKELDLYLPYALLPWFSHQQQRTIAVSHFAQTLDGRIAAATGDSKWIGNSENLTHAHKMRALFDAVLVGAATLRADRPRLTVRHVSGANPLRVILGQEFNKTDITSEAGGPLLVINAEKSSALDSTAFDQLSLAAGPNQVLACRDILDALYQRGIHSVYIEGGAHTTSRFLASSALDQVQIHFSPRILGSGLTGFDFPGIETMKQAVDFHNPRFITIGDQMMFVGEPVLPPTADLPGTG